MNEKAAMGVVFGIMVGLVICVGLFKFANKDNKIKSQYDERQEAIKGRGYKYSYYTMLFLEVILMLVKMAGITFPVEEYLVHTTAVLIGCLVLCVHSIWNGVYWGLNNDHKRYYIIFGVATVLNVIPLAAAIAHGSLTTRGIDSLPVLNVLVLVWMAIIGCVALVKKVLDSKNDAEE